jgi:hypothetical protein
MQLYFFAASWGADHAIIYLFVFIIYWSDIGNWMKATREGKRWMDL